MGPQYEQCAHCRNWVNKDYNRYDVIVDKDGRKYHTHHDFCTERFLDEHEDAEVQNRMNWR